MYHIEIRELIQSKQAIGKPGHKYIGFGVICSTSDFCIALHEIISLCDSPPRRAIIIFASVDVAVCVWPMQVIPSEERAILAGCVNLSLS